METTKLAPTTRVSKVLLEEKSTGIGFFQAVRLLETERRAVDARQAVGFDAAPEQEVAQFTVTQSLGFPASEVVDLKVDEQGRTTLEVSFFGLTGPTGPMPIHYTEWLQQQQRARNLAMRQFFDVINNRNIGLFYRAWKKYRIPFTMESGGAEPGQLDAISRALFSIIGITPQQTRHLARLPVRRLLFFAGYFAGKRRNAISLARMLSEYLGVNVDIRAMQGEWLSIDGDDRVILPDAVGRGINHQLGVNLVIGESVYCIENKFEIVVGPIDHEQARRFGPGSIKQSEIAELTGLYVGYGFQFDIRYIVDAESRPDWTVRQTEQNYFKLGWNTWLPQEVTKRPLRDEIVIPYSGLH